MSKVQIKILFEENPNGMDPLEFFLDENEHRYPLRPEVKVVFQDGVAKLGSIEGQGARKEEALVALGTIVHERFQRLRKISPGVYSDAEYKQWLKLHALIDTDMHYRWYPIEEPVIGKVLKVKDGLLTLDCFTEPEDKLVVSLDDLPPAAAEFGVDDHFGTRMHRFGSRIIWSKTFWEHREPLRTDIGVWDYFDQEVGDEETGETDEANET